MTSIAMSRGKLTEHIAISYAIFEAQNVDAVIQELDRGFAFGVGKRLIRAGLYEPRKDYRYMDWNPIARAARKRLPWARRLVAENPELVDGPRV